MNNTKTNNRQVAYNKKYLQKLKSTDKKKYNEHYRKQRVSGAKSVLKLHTTLTELREIQKMIAKLIAEKERK